MGKKSSPPAPDYSPMAAASAESARLSAELGNKQLAENTRQYEESKAISAPIIAKQAELMDQTKTQGDEYFKNWQAGQEVTTSLKNDVMRDTSAEDAASRKTVTDSMATQASTYKDLAAGIQTTQNGIADQTQRDVNAAAAGIGVAMDKYGGDVNKAIDLYTAGNGAIAEKYGADIENDVGKAVSDARAGQAQATNQAMRQAMRYGISMPDAVGNSTLAQSQMLAATANGSRTDSTNNYRQIVGNSVGMKQNILNTGVNAATSTAGLQTQGAISGAATRSEGATQGLGLNVGAADKTAQIATVARDMSKQDSATAMAKKLDVAGLYNGMTGASAGAYGMANNSGNSAVGNQNSTSAQYLNGMNAGTSTIMGGRQLAQNGLGNILNSQTSVYNSNQPESFGSILGGAGGALTGLAKAGLIGSDRRYKTNIIQIGMHALGIPVYQFDYLPKFARKWGFGRQVGIMVDELANVLPEAISKDTDGHTVVNYAMLKGA